MTDTKFKIGDKVAFTTAGRYRTEQSGELVSIDYGKNGWAQVKRTDGTVAKTRPSTLRAG